MENESINDSSNNSNASVNSICSSHNIKIIVIVVLVLAFAYFIFRYFFTRHKVPEKQSNENNPESTNTLPTDSAIAELVGGAINKTARVISFDGINTMDEVLKNLKTVMFPQVSIMTNQIIRMHPVYKFLWTEKTDGLRQILVFVGNAVCTNTGNHVANTKISYKLTILDTELLNGKNYVFDGCYVNGKNISDLPFSERIPYVETFVKAFSDEKEYDEINSTKQEFTGGDIVENARLDRLPMRDVHGRFIAHKSTKSKSKPKSSKRNPTKQTSKPTVTPKPRTGALPTPKQLPPISTSQIHAAEKASDELVLTMKAYNEVKNIYEVIEFAQNTESPVTHNKIDGVIFQRTDLPYFVTSSYKLKRYVMNTVDFKIRYIPEKNIFFLYLWCSYKTFMTLLQRAPKTNRYSIQHTGVDLTQKSYPDKFLALFSSPFMAKAHLFVPREQWARKGYKQEDIIQISALMKSILANPVSFDNKIIEFSHAIDGWVPYRIRDDKEKPNAYNVGESTMQLLFSPFNPHDNRYFSNKIEQTPLVDTFHKVNQAIRKLMFNKLFQKYPCKNLLDIAGGRGGDAECFINNGVTNIFATDADAEALIGYKNRLDRLGRRNLSFNAFAYTLHNDDDVLFEWMNKRYEYPESKFEVAIMNYAIHYLCDREHYVENLKALSSFINKSLASNGVFMFTYFDGDRMLNDAVPADQLPGVNLPKQESNAPSSPDQSPAISNTENQSSQIQTQANQNDPYGVKVLQEHADASAALGDNEYVLKLNSFTIRINKSTGIINMPLPTIDESGYRDEPLTTSDKLQPLNINILEEYYPAETFSSFLQPLDPGISVLDLSKYIKCVICRISPHIL